MPTICRLIELPPDNAARLIATPGALPDYREEASIHSDVYRYWHAIEYLLGQHRPGSTAAHWLTFGTEVSSPADDTPGARVLTAAQVQALDADLRDIEPEDLIAHFDAAALDAAAIYPATWREWEEDFDPLGQVLEHYYFLKEFMAQRAAADMAAMLYFEVLAEGEV